MRNNSSGCLLFVVGALLLFYFLGGYAIFLLPLLLLFGLLPLFFKGRRMGDGTSYNTSAGSARPLLILFAAIMKADGRVMRTELVYVSEALKKLYPAEQIPELIDELKEILHQNLSIEEACDAILHQHTAQSRLTIIYLLVGLAQADGVVDAQERYLLYQIAARLGVERVYVDAFLRGNHSYSYAGGGGYQEGYNSSGYGYSGNYSGDYSGGYAGGGRSRSSTFSGKDPYTVLGIEPTATDAQVKSAYRKLVNKWHPDRFQSKSQEEIDAATEKFKELQAAYETIGLARGWR